MDKEGTGTLYLTGSNTYTGGTIIDGGTIEIGNNQALGTGLVEISGVATMTSDGGDYHLSNQFVLIPDLTENITAGSMTLDNTISGGSSDYLIKTGEGTLQLQSHHSLPRRRRE